jgi:histone deacetylase 1/2/histone deacetylase 8
MTQDCPSFPALPVYARLVAAATQTACRELVAGTADIAICWDGGRHHTMRNRASGFCYVADVVLGIMYLAKSGRPRAISGGRQGGARGTDRPSGANDVSAEAGQGSRGASSSSDDLTRDATAEDGGSTPAKPDRPSRRPRIMYIDLDIHEGDGVHQAFLSPSRYPASTSTKKPPRPPQVLTLSIHHHSRTFFPPHKPFSGLPDRETPSPFTLSIPLHAYASPSAYAGIWPSVEGIKGSFNPDYVVLQLGLDGLPGDRVGQYGAWGTEGPGGLRRCVQQVRSWGLPLCVLGGGGYDNANAARGWTMATAELVCHGHSTAQYMLR